MGKRGSLRCWPWCYDCSILIWLSVLGDKSGDNRHSTSTVNNTTSWRLFSDPIAGAAAVVKTRKNYGYLSARLALVPHWLMALSFSHLFLFPDFCRVLPASSHNSLSLALSLSPFPFIFLLLLFFFTHSLTKQRKNGVGIKREERERERESY